MISVYNLKPKFRKSLMPVMELLHKRNITANAITGSAIALSFLLGLALWNVESLPLAALIVPIGLFVRMALNALDGMMATTYRTQSKKGELLNEMGDIISDAFIYLPLIKVCAGNTSVIVLFVLLAIVNETAGILAKAVSSIRRYDGPMGKSDRALLTGIYCIIYYFYQPIETYAVYIFPAASMLIVLSTYLRLKNTLK